MTHSAFTDDRPNRQAWLKYRVMHLGGTFTPSLLNRRCHDKKHRIPKPVKGIADASDI